MNKTNVALGIDIGNVIINHRLTDKNDKTLHEEHYSTIPATEGVFDAVKKLNDDKFHGNIFLISKCTLWAQEKIIAWLKDNDFFEEIRKCGKSIALVNTSRGEIADEESLLAALQNGVVKSAAIDVWSHEGNDTNQTVNALRVHPNVFPTSHIAAYTLESRRRCALQCADNVIAAVEGRLKGMEQYIAKPPA